MLGMRSQRCLYLLNCPPFYHPLRGFKVVGCTRRIRFRFSGSLLITTQQKNARRGANVHNEEACLDQ